jgi:hypothetical protein
MRRKTLTPARRPAERGDDDEDDGVVLLEKQDQPLEHDVSGIKEYKRWRKRAEVVEGRIFRFRAWPAA